MYKEVARVRKRERERERGHGRNGKKRRGRMKWWTGRWKEGSLFYRKIYSHRVWLHPFVDGQNDAK